MGSGHAGTSNVVGHGAAPTQPQQVQHEATAKTNLLPSTSTGVTGSGIIQAGENAGDGVFENADVAAMQIDNESGAIAPKKGSGKNNPVCFRCLTKGHVMNDCKTPICCDMCDSDTHVTKACPSMKGAKPTTELCGYAVPGLGFYYIPFSGNQKAKIEPIEAIVKVSDGSLTVKQVKVEHERLVPDWKWVVEEINENSFATTFPSSAELKRMDDWGPVEARSAKAKLTISKKKDAEVYKYEIPKVWVQFRGLPRDLRNFCII